MCTFTKIIGFDWRTHSVEYTRPNQTNGYFLNSELVVTHITTGRVMRREFLTKGIAVNVVGNEFQIGSIDFSGCEEIKDLGLVWTAARTKLEFRNGGNLGIVDIRDFKDSGQIGTGNFDVHLGFNLSACPNHLILDRGGWLNILIPCLTSCDPASTNACYSKQIIPRP